MVNLGPKPDHMNTESLFGFLPQEICEKPEKQEPALAISKNAWHYKYYVFIKKLWGGTIPEKTSLCPYCQTMIWATVIAVIFLPLILFGWICVKGTRWLYRVCVSSGFQKFVDRFDNSFFGEILEKSAECMIKAPFLFTVSVSVFILVVGSSLMMILWGLGYAGYHVLLSIPAWPGAIWLAAKYACWGIWMIFIYFFWSFFHILSGVGEALYWVAYGLRWFFTNGPLLRTIGNWALLVVFVLIFVFVLGNLIRCLCQLKIAKRIGTWLSFKFNGYTEARAEAVARREKIRYVAMVAKEKEVYKPCRLTIWMMNLFELIRSGFKRIFAKTSSIGGHATQILTSFGIFIHFVIAIKKRACPLISFVDDSQNKPEKEST